MNAAESWSLATISGLLFLATGVSDELSIQFQRAGWDIRYIAMENSNLLSLLIREPKYTEKGCILCGSN